MPNNCACTCKQFATGGDGIESRFLEGDADDATDFPLLAIDVETGDGALPGSRAKQRRQHAHHRCLSGAVRAKHAEDFATFHLQVNSVDGDDAAGKLAAKAFHLDGVHGCTSGLVAPATANRRDICAWLISHVLGEVRRVSARQRRSQRRSVSVDHTACGRFRSLGGPRRGRTSGRLFRTISHGGLRRARRGQRSRPRAATGVVIDICGGSATSGPKADMAACMASLWPWFCMDSASAISAKNQ